MEEIDHYTSAVGDSVQQQSVATGAITFNLTGATDGAKLVVVTLGKVAAATTKAQRAAQTVLNASEAVKEAAAKVGGEVESFLLNVAV